VNGVSPKVSVVVVVSERTEPFAEFYREYSRPLRDEGIPYEFIVVAPASRRTLLAPLVALREAGEPIALFESALNVGEAGLLRSVIAHTRGEVILMLAAYRRVAADALPILVRAVEAGSDLVVARRSTTRDSAGNRIQRRFVHGLVRALVGGNFHDLGSGVRASRREVLEELPVYGEFARFLPLFAARDGFRVEEIEVPQHAADRRTRVYSPGTYLRRLMDLLAVFFLVRFRDKPMRFFGLAGGLVSLVGAIVLVVLGVQRVAGQPLADRPMLLVGVLLFVLGVQGVALGLIGEIIVHAGSKRRKVYRLAPPKAP
jgi:hypothetical protein